ncbi:DoxX family protein [Solihabitans fulvus]|uniref:DoxX family protein n=1 Tax=Solihabitans fulvus TaxID=1892852 RepID=A0A5B2XD01_9PSEU|nr:DoxX family protein [Solihabitans fulvus]KAA2260920.1 DoxX family protein [Solihabitans fulvus]
MQRVRDLIALIGRVAVGAVFIAHGWQKLNTWGMDGAAAAFGKMGVPAPTLSAWYAMIVELAGGALLIIGLGLPIVGILIALDMLGALVFVHAHNGMIGAGGYELVLALGIAALVLGFHGGAFSIDRVLSRRRLPVLTGS